MRNILYTISMFFINMFYGIKFIFHKKQSYKHRISSYKAYFSFLYFGHTSQMPSHQECRSFEGVTTDIKTLAFYLPQFHAIPENDEWWGKGFTEWTNVRAASPRFPGHNQPRVPHPDIGYYDLSDPEALRRQAALAKRYGIHGFCFHHYWFSGRRLLEKPLDLLLENPDIDLPFCLCWANENWTRRWEGNNKDILMKQRYEDGDPERFIDEAQKYLCDPRYITIEERPLILIYNELEIPDSSDFFKKMKEHAVSIGRRPPLLYAVLRTEKQNLHVRHIDGFVEFPPHRTAFSEKIPTRFEYNEGRLYDYNDTSEMFLSQTDRQEKFPLPVYKSAMLAWDNSARKKKDWAMWLNFSHEAYYHWLKEIIAYTRRNFAQDQRFIFINAWNEWGEGTYLEPDAGTGYTSLNTTSKALFDLPFDEGNTDPQCRPSA